MPETEATEPDLITEVEDLLAKASMSPWSHYNGKLRPQFDVTIDEILDARGNVVVAWGGFDGLHKSTAYDNAELIAAAPELLRRLVEELKRLRLEVPSLRERERKQLETVIEIRGCDKCDLCEDHQ